MRRWGLVSAAWRRCGLALVVIAGCGNAAPAPVGNDRVSNIGIAVRTHRPDDATQAHLDVSFDLRSPPRFDQLVMVRAACQVGDQRYVSTAHGFGAHGARRHTASPFADAELPGKPTMCDLAIEVRELGTDDGREQIALPSNDTGELIASYCWRGRVVAAGACQ